MYQILASPVLSEWSKYDEYILKLSLKRVMCFIIEFKEVMHLVEQHKHALFASKQYNGSVC